MESSSPLVITIVGAESSGKTTLAKQLAEALSCTWVPEYARAYLETLGKPYEFEDLEAIAKGQWEVLIAAFGSAPGPGSISSLHPLVPSTESFGARRQGESILSSAPYALKEASHNLHGSGVERFQYFISWLQSLQKEIIIVDGGMLTIKMWAKIKYGKELHFVEEVLQEDATSLYLLCRPRKEWEYDPMREAPDLVDRVWIYNQYLREMKRRNYSVYFLQT